MRAKFIKNINIWHLALFTIFVLLFFFSLRQIYDVDIGFHLRGGEWMLENKSFHRHDVFTYTVQNNEYIAMYWLYQIILFLIYKIGSDKFISIWNSILILILFALIYLRLQKSAVKKWLICCLILASLFPFEIRFGVRPEIMTYIFLTATLIILDHYFFNQKNYLHLLPLIQLFWVNFHGLFILGWVVEICYLISTYVHRRSQHKNLLKWVLLSFCAAFFNPYFLKGILFPFYLFTRLQNSSVFKDAITEFASPFSARGFLLTSHSALYIYFLFVLLSIVLTALTYRHRKFHEYLLLIAFGYLSSTAVRNIPLFIIIAIQVIGLSFKDCIPYFRKFITFSKPAEKFSGSIFIVFTIILILRIINNGYYAQRGGGNFGLGFDRSVQPIKMGEFILKNRITGKILNDMNRGSWLIWAVREPVYIDGRLEVIKETLFKEFHDSHQPGGIIKLIDKYNPTLVLFDYSYPEALFWDIDLANSSDWRIIYWDETTVIYAKTGYAEQIEPFSFWAAINKMAIDIDLSEQEKWNILHTPTKSQFQIFFEGLYKRQSYPAALTRMAFYASVKLQFPIAEILYLNALKKTDYHRGEIYFHLGLIYHFMQKFDKAEYCYQRVLQDNPHHKKAKTLLLRLRKNLPPIE
ncbi:MAG: tetratricopeptide repeat protein [bacterium]